MVFAYGHIAYTLGMGKQVEWGDGLHLKVLPYLRHTKPGTLFGGTYSGGLTVIQDTT